MYLCLYVFLYIYLFICFFMYDFYIFFYLLYLHHSSRGEEENVVRLMDFLLIEIQIQMSTTSDIVGSTGTHRVSGIIPNAYFMNL